MWSPPNDKVVGRSLKPLLANPNAQWNYPAFTFKKGGRKSIQYGPWRYIEYEDGSMELYDHRKDPNEWRNLAGRAEYKGHLEKLKRMFDEYKTFETKIEN